MISTVVFSLLLAASGTSEAAPPTADAAAQEAPKAKSKKICRTTGLTGSRIAKKLCKTQEQWDQAESASELTVKGKAGTTMPPQMDTGI
ncbi:MAG: hypothetical protein RIS65_933 [Pseudomonadota bacterium]